LELAECVRLGGVEAVFGTDLSASAVLIAEANVKAAAPVGPARLVFANCDFRDAGTVKGLGDLSLIITNPPLGKRVPVRDLQEMVRGLFDAANRLLRPGGRLVFVNPLEGEMCPAGLRLESKRRVDVGFAHFHIEKYVRRESRARR
jgi:16S rRNA G1207 methylase RsmC